VTLEAPAPVPAAGPLSSTGEHPERVADLSPMADLDGTSVRDREKTTRVVASNVTVARRLSEIWLSRQLLRNFVRSEIKVKYKNSFLGMVWSLLSPAMAIGVYVVVFGIVLKNGIPNFVILLFSGLLAWNLFQTGVQSATSVIVTNAGLVKKMSFPREILPLASVGSASVFFFFQACVMAILLLVLHSAPAWGELWLLPVAIVPLIAFTAAMAVFLAAVNVYLRDTQHLVEVLVGAAWFWGCPIVYSFQLKVLPYLSRHGITWLYLLNPLTPIVLTFQRVIYAKQVADSTIKPFPPEHLLPSWGPMTYVEMDALVLAASLLFFYLAMLVFGRLAGHFAEEL
jgi:ABC-2 type transport system permease protein